MTVILRLLATFGFLGIVVVLTTGLMWCIKEHSDVVLGVLLAAIVLLVLLMGYTLATDFIN